jgi:hypothetical protein
MIDFRCQTRIIFLRSLIASIALPLSVAPARAQKANWPEPRNWTAAEDHQQMMEQLGIKALRPGPSGNEQAPNHANYDESKANPFPTLPEVLTFKNGQKVTSAQQWPQRRAEIVEDFEREVYGRVPNDAPKVTWTITTTDTGTVAGRHVIGRQLSGHADNADYPLINVDISLTLVVPADARGAVPVMMMFRGGSLAQAVGRPVAAASQFRRRRRGATRPRPSSSSSTDGATRSSIRRAFRLTTAPGSRGASSVSRTRDRRGSRTTGVRCAPGPGAHHARWIISRQIAP